MKKLIYLVTEDWYFFSHRQPMARAAKQAGFDVAVVTNVGRHKEAIEALGIRVIPWQMERRSLNPLSALSQVKRLIEIYKAEKPDLVHHIALKPILFGSLAALIAKVPHVLNAFAGLGVIFRSNTKLARTIRPPLTMAFRLLLKRPNSWLLFQNKDDRACMAELGVVANNRTVIIRGSGVDVDRYTVKSTPEQPPFICAFAGRMIDSKGLPTMRDAFEQLKSMAPNVQLWLCGAPDFGNPGSWDKARLEAWCAENPAIVWKGHQEDMSSIWEHAHVALQPSWGGEGLPKALLEAGACGRAMIASDVSGCREVVIDGRNGYLVAAENAGELAQAIATLANDADACTQMGLESRKIVEGDLSAAAVTHATETLYKLITAR